MPKQSSFRKRVVTIALASSAALIAAGQANAHGRGGGHYGGGFVNTIHPIVRGPIVNTIRPIVRGPIVNTLRPIVFHPTLNTIGPIVRTPVVSTIHPIVVSPVLAATRPVLVHPPTVTAGPALPSTGPIIRDHRGGDLGGGITITPVPRPPSSTSFCIISCGAHLGTPTYYNAGSTIRDHRTNPGGWGG